MNRKQLLKDAAIAVSLANLCFIVSWNDLLDSAPRDAFNVYNRNSFVTIILNVLLLAALFWFACTLARRSTNPIWLKLGRWVLPLVLMIPLDGLLTILIPGFNLMKLFSLLKVGYFNAPERMVIGTVLIMAAAYALAPRLKIATGAVMSLVAIFLGQREPVWLALVLVILMLFSLARWRCAVVRFASTGLLILSPFIVVTFFQASSFGAKFSDRPPSLLIKGTSAKPRVLWLVFDELDQAMLFSRRPADLKLPEIDRLKEASVYASNAYPPSDSTLMSMPAMITGRFISDAKVNGPADLFIQYAGSSNSVLWSSQSNIFGEARGYDVNSAVIGWYHPYCRILGQSLAYCHYQEFGRMPFGESMSQQLKTLARTVPLATYCGFFEEKDLEQHERRRAFMISYTGVLEHARKAAVDRDLGLIMVHWPIPHPPAIFNHLTNEFELGMQSGYLGNLALVDRTIGELRRDLESAGLWDDTIVLITSDHWFRSEIHFRTKEDDEALAGLTDHRVPFLLKLADQNVCVPYDREFNNVLVHDLLLALLRAELKSPESVVSWLDNNRSIGESPYNYHRLSAP
ncbi:MAG TPA: sulfatase-like hydrolase/transferase [Blastocatellia bacterium]|nr:sulfatase-like hydrolase/transferase [Blastocatellia bacterium]